MIHQLRKEYKLHSLSEEDTQKYPMDQFHRWFSEAISAGILEPNAMTLATATPEGKPSARIVLLKDYRDQKFTFFTNYQSRKGNELEMNPQATLLFFWQELERQVRIEGIVQKISLHESEEYFHSRPIESQIGALTSNQSHIISGRQEIETKYSELYQTYKNKQVPKPENWGGYFLTPAYFEFWQGRQNRLHDRIIYILENKIWVKKRLAP